MITLKTLYELIKLHSISNKKGLSIIKFMEYLIGNITQNSFTDTTLYNLYNNTKKLSYDNLNKLASYKNRGKEFISQDINIPCFLEDANNLLSKELPYYTRLNDLNSILNAFVFLHFFNTLNPYILFQYNGKVSQKKYVHWEAMEQQILSAMENSNLLFLTGNPGSGKTQLLINTLPEYSFTSHTDIHWLDAHDTPFIPLKEQIINISFIGMTNKKLQLEELLSILKEKSSTSILIIDRPEITDEDLSFCRDYLRKLNLKIIITTYRKALPSDFVVLDIDNRPADNLIKIFYSYNSDSAFTDNDIYNLSKRYDNNVYVLTLISKAFSQKNNTLSKNMLLDEDVGIWDKKGTTKIHTDYYDLGKHTGQQILFLIGHILHSYDVSFLKNHASELSIWTKAPISQNLLSNRWGEFLISTCVANGILQYYDSENTKLFMPRLISDTIWSQYAIDCNEYSEKIFKLIDILDYGQTLSLPYDDLYQLIFNMILRFHFQVTTMPSRIGRNVRDTFEGWNILLIDIIERFMRLGNYKYALKILPYLYVAHNKKSEVIFPKKLRSITTQLLEKQANYMKSENMPEALESMIDFFTKLPRSTLSPKNDTSKIVFYLSTYIIRDMADCIIDLILTITGNKLLAECGEATANCTVPNLTLILDKAFIILAKTDPYYAYYLKIAHFYYLTISSKLFYIPNAQAYIDYLLVESNCSSQLRFQTRGLQLYFSLTLFYMHNGSSSYDPDLFRIFTSEYNSLYKEFTKSICPYHTSHIFYSCTFLLASYLPYTLHPYTYHNLLESMKNYKSFNHNQLSLNARQVKDYGKMIDEKISELQKQMIIPI